MKSRSLIALFTATAVTGIVGAYPAAIATAAQSVPVVEAEALPGTWFIELKGKPTADGGNLQSVRAEKAAFRAAASQAGAKFTERYAYDTLFNGLSIRASQADIQRIRQLDQVAAVWPVAIVDAPAKPDSSLAPDMYTALAMTGANHAQTQLGLTGAGIKVAVMDTGIDIDHPAFGGDGVHRTDSELFPSARIPLGYDFVGDAFDANPSNPTYNPIATPDDNPDDCGGHGTHVAGIVGANDATNGLKGVAPGVTFGAYRVFGCNGSTTADIMIAAMERALADGMDVLNMSIGSAFQWPQYPTAVAASRLVNKGMVVVASIGNSGASGLYSAGAPGLGDKVIGTASFDNSHVALNTFTISPDATSIGYGAATGAPPPPTSGTFPMERTGTSASAADACNATAPAPGSLTGKVALIRRGTCPFYEKAYNAQLAGAIGVVLYNNSAGRFSPTVAGTPAVTIPVVAVSDTEGVLINNRLAAGAVDMTWTNQTGSFLNPTGGLISSFSSYGLSPDLVLKPDIGAPGGLIYSSYPLDQGGYAAISGTSMASPHVAGTVALLLEAKPKTNAQSVRGILQNTAKPKNWWGNPGLGFIDQVHRQGAGMVDIKDALHATTRIEPSKLSLGESEHGPAVRTLTIRNSGNTDVTYDLSHAPALNTNASTFAPGATTGFATVAFNVPSVTVPARGTATVDVTITANSGVVNFTQYGGYLVFTPQGGGQVYRVPYAGLTGDYQAKQVLVPTASNFPWLAKTTNGSSFSNNVALAPYTMVGFDTPYFAIHLDHQSRRLRLEAFDASTGASLGRISDDEYLPRNSTATGIFAFRWTGDLFRGNGRNANQWSVAPNGQYVVKLSVLKALGDESNPAHWETWTSPLVTIARP
jgi:minor extracellular serine protease Vpr